jgi:coenzyme F420 hydrogenase subunit beta
METKNYQDLKKEVWDAGICSGCGACVAVCPADALCFGKPGQEPCPTNTGYCKSASDQVACGACYYACPRTAEVTGEIIGPNLEIVSAKAGFEVTRRQSGGAVTALLVNALEEGMIDAVVTVSEDRWTMKPSSAVITSSEELIFQAGSRYNWWVPLLSALKTAVVQKKYQRIAVVGVPCVVQALQKIRESDLDLLRPYGKAIRLVVGLFCTESFDYQALMEKTLKGRYGVETWQIEKMDVKGKLEVTMKDGSTLVVPLHELEDTIRPGCRYCRDLTSVYADISAGAVGSPRGETTLIIRNQTGEIFVRSAEKNGRLITGGDVDLAAIEKLGRAKQARPSHP